MGSSFASSSDPHVPEQLLHHLSPLVCIIPSARSGVTMSFREVMLLQTPCLSPLRSLRSRNTWLQLTPGAQSAARGTKSSRDVQHCAPWAGNSLSPAPCCRTSTGPRPILQPTPWPQMGTPGARLCQDSMQTLGHCLLSLKTISLPLFLRGECTASAREMQSDSNPTETRYVCSISHSHERCVCCGALCVAVEGSV